MTRQIRTVTTTRYAGTERRARARYVLVYCPVCERFISEESRHPCDMTPELRAARLEARKVKQMETGIRDYD